jgi:hypothetical protein
MLHFDNNLTHLQISPFSILSIHVYFGDKSHELVGEVDIGEFSEETLDFCEVVLAFDLVGEDGVAVLEGGCAGRLALLPLLS